MTQHVFDNPMTAHVWAQFSQDSGRSNNGNFYFEGRSLYSYGAHYVAGYLPPAADDVDGVGPALINGDSYSVSTGRHVSYARQAVLNYRTFPNLTALARLFEAGLSMAAENLNPHCFPPEPGNVSPRKLAEYMAPRLKAHFSSPENLPSDLHMVAGIFAAAQCDNPERRARVAWRTAEKAAERQAAKRAKAKERQELENLIRAANTRPDDMATEIEAHARRVAPHYENAKAEWESRGRKIHRAMKAGRKAGHTARVRAAQPVYKAIRENLYRFEAAAKRANRLFVWRNESEELKTGVAAAHAFKEGRTVAGPTRYGRTRPLNSHDMRTGATAAREMVDYLTGENDFAAPAAHIMGHAPGELAERLTALAGELDSVAVTAAKAERRKARRVALAHIKEAAGIVGQGIGAPAVVAESCERAIQVVSRYASRPAIGTYQPEPFYPVPGAWRVSGWTPDKFARLESVFKAARDEAREELDRTGREMALDAWRACEELPRELSGYLPRAMPGGAAYVRARDVVRDDSGAITGGELETSQGARVPLAHAVHVFRFLKACRDKGEGWQRNGRALRVGPFEVDSIKPDGSFRAGCHAFEWCEVERLARELGLDDIAPADTTENRAHA
tara:strand:- start:2150 stop:4006 length:1857 start_codon:yes stop_codon:yes gene_type:complete